MNGSIYHNHNQHHINQGLLPSHSAAALPLQPHSNMTGLLGIRHNSLNQTAISNGQPSIVTPSSMNRSQRCGVCRGCQCKPCGQCTYCQDSPQFGGPGVKKQSCIERRCLRVLENRLQRDAPSFKARVGCNNCEDCRLPDCLGCLVCLDKRFFDNRYMTGAMCAKKRCNNATSIDLPIAQNAEARQIHKRSYEHSGVSEYQLIKRRAQTAMESIGLQHQRMLGMHPPVVPNGQCPPPGAPIYPVAPIAQQQPLRLLPHQLPHPTQLLMHHPQATSLSPMTSTSVSTPLSSPIFVDNSHFSHSNQQYLSSTSCFMPPTFSTQPYFDDSSVADPFLPPSYAPEMKNAVVLQPL